jgi:hypothetical protein
MAAKNTGHDRWSKLYDLLRWVFLRPNERVSRERETLKLILT